MNQGTDRYHPETLSLLPQWIWVGSFALSAIAGIVNTIGFYGVAHEALTHLTGTATNLAISLAQAKWASFCHLGAIMGSFFAGAAIGGIIVGKTTLQLGMRYGLALALESLLLFLGMLFLHRQGYGDLLVTMACGLQNALASTYSGAIVRSTHITGLVTDLGVMLGHWLRGEKPSTRKATLLASILAGFISGSFLGYFLFEVLGNLALMVPVTLTASASVIYTFWINAHHIASGFRQVRRGHRHRKLVRHRHKKHGRRHRHP